MAKVEDNFFCLIIQMARIRYLLTLSSCLQIVNDLISGTQSEIGVINFKNTYF